MDITKRIGNYFEKDYQAGRKIIWKVMLARTLSPFFRT